MLEGPEIRKEEAAVPNRPAHYDVLNSELDANLLPEPVQQGPGVPLNVLHRLLDHSLGLVRVAAGGFGDRSPLTLRLHPGHQSNHGLLTIRMEHHVLVAPAGDNVQPAPEPLEGAAQLLTAPELQSATPRQVRLVSFQEVVK